MNIFRANLLGDDDFKAILAMFKSHFPRYKFKYAAILLLIGISSSATAAAAWLVRDVVNDFFVKRQGDFLIPLFLAIVALFVAKGAASYWQSVISARISYDIVARTQRWMIDHMLAQRVRFFERYTSDDLTMRITLGASSFGQILNLVVLNGARDAATVTSLLVVMVAQDLTLTLICIFVAPAVFLAITRLLKHIKALMHQEMLTVAELNKHMREIAQGVKVIKSYNLEPLIKAEAGAVVDAIQDRSNKLAALQNAPVPIIDSIGGIGIGLTILYAGYRSVYGAYDPGTFLSFVTALLLALDPTRRLSQLRVTLKTALVGVEMVQEMLSHNDPDHEGVTKGGQIAPSEIGVGIEFKNVRFAYDGGGDVLRGFSLRAQPGEMIALVGPSGAGKSTIFSVLLRFHRHQAGEIIIGGKSIEAVSVPELRDRIAYVGQSNFIFSGTIRENLSLRRSSVPQDKIDAACEAVGLRDYIASLPRGFDTPVGELGSLISGGQAQRLNIARAIIKDAPILLFDEVTSALDADNEELIRHYMHSQAGKKTILVVAHRISTVRQADKIALVEDGVVKAFGSHQEMLSNSDYYGRAATLQLIS
jgi:ATP-binding cassette, subfamily B, bacterial MsbA